MSAPTPAGGDDSPLPGYYPDPSIPGYVRYWNGAAWVPGTSRPAPKAGEVMPETPGRTGRVPDSFVWRHDWPGRTLRGAVLYELHIG
ncbi:DUF2510 domain-containing protein, partial [Streptomyces sp. NPDC001985]|uniref:DUF2510 domain-containing protein n=1 Tax=Streptomyces sp. NPDC001985 TaxID=3154406 RepID=UPI00332FA979